MLTASPTLQELGPACVLLYGFVHGGGKVDLTLVHSRVLLPFKDFDGYFLLLRRFPIHVVQEAYSRMVLLRTPGRFVPLPEAKMATPAEDAVYQGKKAPYLFFSCWTGYGACKVRYLLLSFFLVSCLPDGFAGSGHGWSIRHQRGNGQGHRHAAC